MSHKDKSYKAHSLRRGIMRKIGGKCCSKLIKRNSSARILVVLHLFYMNSWQEIKEYLKNLDFYSYDLAVAYTEGNGDKAVLEDIASYKPNAVIKECRNLGYDVGSFTEIMGETCLDNYDIIFKLQSKGVKRPKIYIYGNYLKKRDWFLNLYEGCIGAFTVHKTIDRLMNDKSVGLVAAENLIVADPVHKQNMVKAYMREQGIEIPDKYLFVAGTCFAVRAELMAPIKAMGLKVEDYPPADRAFSLAHKMERVICLVVLNKGADFYGNRVMSVRRALRKLNPDYFRRKKYAGTKLLEDKRFTLDDEFVYFSLEHKLVRKYELVDVPLKDILRGWNGVNIPLTECLPYKYLVTGDPEVYEEYCRLNRELFGLNIMSRERFDRLMKSLDEKGFERESSVVINQDNVLLDGQHRCCYLLFKYGGDYKVPCVRIYEKSAFEQKIKDFLRNRLSDKGFEKIKKIYHRFF